MLSRIAHGLYTMGRTVERVQNVTRILEVNHKMNLERSIGREDEVWAAIAHSFLCPVEEFSERALYGVLVTSDSHPYSVRRCLREARDDCRAMRDHISDEMWLHLNRNYLEFQAVEFRDVIQMGRSEFNRRIEVFCDALHGLADDTMIQGEAWAFLKLGKYLERSLMVCRILDIKRTSISHDFDGAPADVHHWQALLRSLSVRERVSLRSCDRERGESIRGAAASHAWVQAWHRELGWIGIDPTNNKLVDWQYVRVAVGRDYSDVQPVSGVFLGNARQSLGVEVEVKRIG